MSLAQVKESLLHQKMQLVSLVPATTNSLLSTRMLVLLWELRSVITAMRRIRILDLVNTKVIARQSDRDLLLTQCLAELQDKEHQIERKDLAQVNIKCAAIKLLRDPNMASAQVNELVGNILMTIIQGLVVTGYHPRLQICQALLCLIRRTSTNSFDDQYSSFNFLISHMLLLIKSQAANYGTIFP